MLVAFTHTHQVKKMYPHTSPPVFSLISFTDTILDNAQPTCDKPYPMPDKPHPTDDIAYMRCDKPHPTDNIAYKWSDKGQPRCDNPHLMPDKPHLFFINFQQTLAIPH